VSDEHAVVNQAICFASARHRGQVDKAGVNYILHPLRVMLALKDQSPAVQAVAVLHDVVEDTSATLEHLRIAGFPEDVVTAVDAISRGDGERYADYLLRLVENPIARRVKLADIEDNISRATPELAGLRRRYEWARLVLHSVESGNPVDEVTRRDAEASEEAWTGRRDLERADQQTGSTTSESVKER